MRRKTSIDRGMVLRTVEVYRLRAPKKMTQSWWTRHPQEKQRCNKKDSIKSESRKGN